MQRNKKRFTVASGEIYREWLKRYFTRTPIGWQDDSGVMYAEERLQAMYWFRSQQYTKKVNNEWVNPICQVR